MTNNLRFPGQYWDEETGLHWNLNRYFDPETGTYTQVDPFGSLGGFNTYSYVRANPLIKIDPFGLYPVIANPSCECRAALKKAHADKNGLKRASDNWAVIEAAASAHGIDPNVLAAIAIRETNFRNINERKKGGKGRGIFQIDIGKNPSVKESNANDITYAANFAANMLATNMASLSADYPELTKMQLLQATAESSNGVTSNGVRLPS